MVSGVAPSLSGIVSAISIDACGQLRELYLEKVMVSGTVRLAVYCDNDLLLDGQVVLGSGVNMPYVDVIGTAIKGSGATLISGVVTTTMLEPVSFTENLDIKYSATSGSVTIRAIADLNKRLIQT